jgi:hypothetical protein
VADFVAITSALAEQITEFTGLRADAQARDQISPPVAVILHGQPFISYGQTMDETMTINLVVLVIVSDAAPAEKSQRALDAYLGLGSGETVSIPAAILADPTLSGTVHFCEPVTAGPPGRLEYAGVPYFGARINLQAGAI